MDDFCFGDSSFFFVSVRAKDLWVQKRKGAHELGLVLPPALDTRFCEYREWNEPAAVVLPTSWYWQSASSRSVTQARGGYGFRCKWWCQEEIFFLIAVAALYAGIDPAEAYWASCCFK